MQVVDLARTAGSGSLCLEAGGPVRAPGSSWDWEGAALREAAPGQGARGPAPYRPRHPEATAFYRVIEGWFDRYAQVHAERFEPRAGPLRAVVGASVAQYLDCGRLEGGFARLRCATCGAEHLLALACRSKCTSSAQVESPARSSGGFGSSYR